VVGAVYSEGAQGGEVPSIRFILQPASEPIDVLA